MVPSEGASGPPTVLGIVGSPRRGGNTDVLVKAALEGAERAGARTEVIYLADLSIGECDGCHACWGGDRCSKRDDMSALYERLARADAFVLGTPVYWYGPTGLLKLFIDRLVYFNCPEHRPHLRGKPAAVVVPFEEEDLTMADGVLDLLGRSLGYLEMRLAGAVVAPSVTRKGEVAGHPELLEAATQLGRRLLE